MISEHLKKNLNILQSLVDLPENIVRKLIDTADKSLVIAIVEIILNLLEGVFEVGAAIKKKLKKFEFELRKLAGRKKLSKNCRVEKKLINLKKFGYTLLSLIIPAALNYIFNSLPL